MSIRNLLTFAAIAATTGGNLLAQTISTTTLDGDIVTVTALTDRIIRVTTNPQGIGIPKSPLVVLDEPDATTTTWSTGNEFRFMTTAAGLLVTLRNSTGTVVITGKSSFIVGDTPWYFEEKETMNTTIFTSGGEYYGAGERAHSMNLAGDTLVMYNRPNYGYAAGDQRNSQMNISMPLVISSQGYAILFDDYGASKLILDNPIKYISESWKPITYYYIDGYNWEKNEFGLECVMRELSQLTGRQPMAPLWTLGYITSKYGYHSQEETLGVVDTLKRHGYPLDGLVLDLYWYGREEDMGRLDWDKSKWPDPKKMLKKLNDKNIKTVAISQPYVLENGLGADNYNKLSANGLLLNDSTGNTLPVEIWVGTGGMFDMSNPATRDWLSERYKTVLLDNGITGLWGDLGEPEKHPEAGLHHNGLPARQYHNLYGNDWSRLAYETMKAARPDERPMAMMRGGTIGMQRYGVFPWSGDVARSWEGMQAQPTIMIHSGLSGLGYMSHDVGGFAVDPDHPSDPEMYLRWMQLGLFSPVLRTHAQSMAEPYNYPEIEPQLLELIKARYAWLPYNYTLAYENAAFGFPLVRPINFYDYSGKDIDDQYLWGRDIMVAPVLQPGVTERQVIVPPGNWIDFNNPGKTYHTGDTITMAAPLDVIPMLVKEGAIIPMATKPMQSTADHDASSLILNFYPGASNTRAGYGEFYDDDHRSPDVLEKGQYSLLKYRWDYYSDNKIIPHLGKDIRIDFSREGSYPGMKPETEITLVLHRVKLPEGAKATINGKNFKIVHTADGIPAIKFKMTDKAEINITDCEVVE